VLAAAGFTPEVAGLCHGFLVERWRDDLAPLDLRTAPRAALCEQVGRYLGFRARAFPADAPGADRAALVEMIRVNAGRDVRAPDTPARPIAIDGRLHAWEWLVDPRTGALVKCDAHDHHASHDLIGCQDLAWDVAGATIELGLSPDEERRLIAATEHAVDPAWLAFARVAYLAFQRGRHAIHAHGPEAARLTAAADRYARALAALDA
jgi:hypothetical protein